MLRLPPLALLRSLAMVLIGSSLCVGATIVPGYRGAVARLDIPINRPPVYPLNPEWKTLFMETEFSLDLGLFEANAAGSFEGRAASSVFCSFLGSDEITAEIHSHSEVPADGTYFFENPNGPNSREFVWGYSTLALRISVQQTETWSLQYEGEVSGMANTVFRLMDSGFQDVILFGQVVSPNSVPQNPKLVYRTTFTLNPGEYQLEFGSGTTATGSVPEDSIKSFAYSNLYMARVPEPSTFLLVLQLLGGLALRHKKFMSR